MRAKLLRDKCMNIRDDTGEYNIRTTIGKNPCAPKNVAVSQGVSTRCMSVKDLGG